MVFWPTCHVDNVLPHVTTAASSDPALIERGQAQQQRYNFFMFVRKKKKHQQSFLTDNNKTSKSLERLQRNVICVLSGLYDGWETRAISGTGEVLNIGSGGWCTPIIVHYVISTTPLIGC